jgi:glycosyltransferase involved in cell wall biosynthesis
VPVYNEEATIEEVVRRVLAAPYTKQIIIVNDGSIDNTGPLLDNWRGIQGIAILEHTHNRGKGAAIRTALHHANGLFTIIQDADLENDPQDYPSILAPLLGGKADVVFGSRYLRPQAPQPWRLFRWGVALLNFGFWLFYGIRITDVATCYKALPTKLLKEMDLQCERFEFCPEVAAKACRLGLTIREVPIRYQARTRRAGKKIHWTDGVYALATLWKLRQWRPT